MTAGQSINQQASNGMNNLYNYIKKQHHKQLLIVMVSLSCLVTNVHAQTELAPWGNITGIRIDGQLMKFETYIAVVKKGWTRIKATGKERQRPRYNRNGNQQVVNTNIDSLYFIETVTDIGKSSAAVRVQLTSKSNDTLEGIYFTISVPGEQYAGGNITINDLQPVKLAGPEAVLDQYLQTPANRILFSAPGRQLQFSFKQPVRLLIKNPAGNNKNRRVFIPIHEGAITNGASAEFACTIKTSGEIDKTPVTLTLNTDSVGRIFDGLGGNFRLQNTRIDPQVIDYCLQHLDVRWGRAEMPWRFWQPEFNTDPIVAARSGKLHPHVQRSMEITQQLFKKGMPIILSAWSGPSWAVIGEPKFQPGADGVWGNPLDQTKATHIYKSIADYIVYLKEKYDVEVSMFSFNESDLGINIRQTGEEHAKLIRELGAYFVSRGLKTKLLLGDNSDATTYGFIDPAMADPATHPYIGAISFHSWRGWDKETLQKWADAATELDKPLLIGEGSIDAAAWNYPDIFEELTYAMEEINLYTRILSICQPASILQWQLTADYSPLAGGGIFGDTSPLRPTRRFWNLKQLSATPPGLKAIPLHSDAATVSCAALGDNDRNIYAFHLVNNDNTRMVTLTGIPSTVKTFKVFITDATRSMELTEKVLVKGGKVIFTLQETSYTTLVSE